MSVTAFFLLMMSTEEVAEEEDETSSMMGLTLLMDGDVESSDDEHLEESEDSSSDDFEEEKTDSFDESGQKETKVFKIRKSLRRERRTSPSKKYRVVVLVSGGKDSMFNAMECVARGHELVAFANIAPDPKTDDDDLSSFMYQTVGHELIDAIATCAELPLLRRYTKCRAKTKSLRYENTSGDEVEDLYELLLDVKTKYPQVEAVSVGAIFSDYQRNRVENVCSRLNLIPLCFMWRREQRDLLREMISKHMECVVVKVACLGLNRRHIGKTIRDIESHLLELNIKYGVHPCGEGGEYETLTLDCPLYKRKRIVLDRVRVLRHSEDEDVISMRIEAFHLEEKKSNSDIVNERDVFLRTVPSISLEEKMQTRRENVENMKMSATTIHMELTKAPNLQQTYDSIYEETISLMKEIERKLQMQNCELEDAIHVRLYVRDMSDFGEINRAFCEMFGGKTAKHVPARSCVQIIHSDCRVCASCVATSSQTERNMLWVRSISSWAPTNIGPYCQANTIRNDIKITYLAGQIGLDPSTMQLVSSKGGWGSELIQCVSNCKAVLNAVYEKDETFRVMRCVAYVSWKECGMMDDSVPCSEISTSVRLMCRGLFTESDLPVSIVPVPKLPRDAAIELELIASQRSRSETLSYTKDHVHLEASFVRRRCVVASVSFSCDDDEEEEDVSLNFQEIIDKVIFEKCQLDDASTLCINILAFVVLSCDSSSCNELEDEIERSFRDRKIGQIKLSVLPVRTLSTKSEFLHVLMECFHSAP